MIPSIRMTNFFPALRPAIDDTEDINMKQGTLEYWKALIQFLLLVTGPSNWS